MIRVLVFGLLAATSLDAAPTKEPANKPTPVRLGTASPASKAGPGPNAVHALTYLDAARLFAATDQGAVMWDLGKRQPAPTKPVAGPALAAVSAWDRLFVGSNKKVHVFELSSASSRAWDSATDAVAVLTAAANGRRMAFADRGQSLSLVDVEAGKPLGTLDLPSQPVAASFTANGRVLGVATRDGAARVYAIGSDGKAEPQWVRRVARSSRIGAAFSPDGRVFAVSSAGRVMIVEAVAGRPMFPLERRFGEGDVRVIAFSPDSQLLALGSNGPDPVVRVWHVPSATEVATFTGHLGDVNALAFSPDGKTLASAGTDSSIMLSPIPTGARPDKAIMGFNEAWEAIDTLDGPTGYAVMGSLLANGPKAVAKIQESLESIGAEQAKIRKWIGQLDADEFRVREAASRQLLRSGLRASALLTEPGRKPLGTEGEQRIRQILDAFDNDGLRAPEQGLFADSLRIARGIRVLELMDTPAARDALAALAKSSNDDSVRRQTKAALGAMAPAK